MLCTDPAVFIVLSAVGVCNNPEFFALGNEISRACMM